ncbi:MAG: DNA-directed RNA polymerase subunit beta [Pseudomonadota bacterium]
MVRSFTERKRIRKHFGRLNEIAEMPDLIEMQKASYKFFLYPQDKNTPARLDQVLRSVFPITDFSNTCQLEFVNYELDKPKYDVEECRRRDMTYAASLRATLRLLVWDVDEATDARSIRGIKEQEVYIGDIPLMTENGTFVVHGTERVVVSQMHRSPGVFFDHDRGKTHISGRFLYSARIIPYRGSWLDFEFDIKDILHVRIDRRRKLPVTTLMLALDDAKTEIARAQANAEGRILDPLEVHGMSRRDILMSYYNEMRLTYEKNGWKIPTTSLLQYARKIEFDVADVDSGEVLLKAGQNVTPRSLKSLDKKGVSHILIPHDYVIDRFLSDDVVLPNGLVIAEAGDEITEELFTSLQDQKITQISVLDIDYISVGAWLRNTLANDRNRNREDALIDIYRVMRPGEPPTAETAEELFQGLFFNSMRYDLSAVGRVKMNSRLKFSNKEVADTVRVLRKGDILAIVNILLHLRDGRGDIDDIDHLGNRRVRSVGELLENQYRVGLLRMERTIKERMSSADIDTMLPNDLVNAKPVTAAVREFFGSSQLSQFMDQTNPLSEITHKRRLSALGPGGLTRERAGFEVRDVHATHYGRICPIETPEGPNIGLINSLATFARVNQYGFIETPYHKVENGCITDEIIHLSAMDEDQYTIAQANSPRDENGKFLQDLVPCRKGGDYIVSLPTAIDLIDVSPKQLVSVAASLIPFLENDDANRALMGSNMQRQAVPLLQSEAPLVGTGMESRVARDSGAIIIADRSGVIDQVDATRIVIRVTKDVGADQSAVDIYSLRKFQRSNQNTCINQRPLVKVGDQVQAGDIIADGPSIDLGELALGRNVLVAFMPWNGYNFEDSILISERIVSEDVFTSVHIEEFEVAARDTKLGQEEITRDIPNIGEDALKNLDEAGIVYIGAEVEAGDILVGKVTPKSEAPTTPEDKLLKAIFGEKSSNVRDTSLRLPPGNKGTVVAVNVFSRHGIDKDERGLSIERKQIEALAKDRDDERAILERSFRSRFIEIADQKPASVAVDDIKAGDLLSEQNLQKLPTAQWHRLRVDDPKTDDQLAALVKLFKKSIGDLLARFEDKVEKVRSGDELAPGVMKMIKVFVATKRKLQPGDKMAGRHGNKGVISKIIPIEDMPYLEDGTPVDIVLNPLGVPSRMNVGQILETHLGWCAAGLGKQVADALEKYKQDQDEQTLRETLKIPYSSDSDLEAVSNLGRDELIELASNVSKGVPMATPVFDGAHEDDINEMLEQAKFATSGQAWLIDGRTGERFDRQVTVGYIYMLKLHHLVDDKIHARSVGPYSLVTQQPLGGKAQFGGQRFGEMEVWALESYGAAHILQEMLTVKSDDVSGRTKVYESIIRNNSAFESGIPESFNVLIKELRSLGMNVEMLQN